MIIIIYSTAAMVAGFVLDALFGDPYRFPHIVRWMGKLITLLEKTIRRSGQSALRTARPCNRLLPTAEQEERLGGIVLVAATLLVCAAVPLALLYLSYCFFMPLGFVLESLICYQLLAAKSLKTESMKVYYSLQRHDIEEARKNVSMIVGRDTSALDRDGITRAAVETVAENTSDGVTAPLLYIMLGGAVLGCLYKAVNTMDSMVGYKNHKYLHFGRFAAKTDDAFNYIPSRLCALLMIASAYTMGFNSKNALYIWQRDRRKHASPNSAQTEAVCAGALGIQLAGPAIYDGTLHDKPYIGDNTRPVKDDDIVNANRLMYAATVLTLIIAIIFRIICVWLIAAAPTASPW